MLKLNHFNSTSSSWNRDARKLIGTTKPEGKKGHFQLLTRRKWHGAAARAVRQVNTRAEQKLPHLIPPRFRDFRMSGPPPS